MSVEFDRGSPGKFDPRTLDRTTLSRWTGRTQVEDRMLLYTRCMHKLQGAYAGCKLYTQVTSGRPLHTTNMSVV